MSRKSLRHGRQNDASPLPEQVVSATECTGLLPVNNRLQEQAEHLAALRAIPPIRPTEDERK